MAHLLKNVLKWSLRGQTYLSAVLGAKLAPKGFLGPKTHAKKMHKCAFESQKQLKCPLRDPNTCQCALTGSQTFTKVSIWGPKQTLYYPPGWETPLICSFGWLNHGKLLSWEPKHMLQCPFSQTLAKVLSLGAKLAPKCLLGSQNKCCSVLLVG